MLCCDLRDIFVYHLASNYNSWGHSDCSFLRSKRINIVFLRWNFTQLIYVQLDQQRAVFDGLRHQQLLEHKYVL